MDKSWIFTHKANDSYKRGVEEFLNFAFEKSTEDGKIACPCIKCYNCKYLKKATVRKHLLNHGFDRNYRLWICHGEIDSTFCSAIGSSESAKKKDEQVDDGDKSKRCEEQVDSGSLPKPAKKEGQDKVDPFQEFDDVEKLAFTYRLYNIKKNNGWSDESFAHLVSFLKTAFPPLSELPQDFNDVKDMMKDMNLEQDRSDACCSSSSSRSAMEDSDVTAMKCPCCSGNLTSKSSKKKNKPRKSHP